MIKKRNENPPQKTRKKKQVALMRHQLKNVGSAARSGPQRYASMVSNVMDIAKPQESFREETDNSRDTPFVPRLREKPNAVTPLDLAPVMRYVYQYILCFARVNMPKKNKFSCD